MDMVSSEGYGLLRDHDQARQRASRLIDRWMVQGFDTLIRHPSGYCSPANSKVLRMALGDGFRAHPIASEDAAAAVADWLARGW